jgi:hypothetical protein
VRIAASQILLHSILRTTAVSDRPQCQIVTSRGGHRPPLQVFIGLQIQPCLVGIDRHVHVVGRGDLSITGDCA